MEEVELSGHCNDSVPKMDNGTTSKKSMASLFSASDKVDYALMFFGSLGSCVHGAGLPVFFVLFGRMIDSLGHLSNNPHRLSSRVSENALYLIYLGLIVMVSSWIGVASWMQTGERQTARLRVKYLKSIMKKDISFFDTEAREANLIFHISSDAVLVQDAIGDQTGHALRYLSQFVVGFAVGFASVWKLTLVTLAVVPLIAMAGVAYTVVMSTFTERSEAAYAEAGKVAEEAISQIRTVYSFVGEKRAIEEYSKSLNKALEFGKKGGLAKGIGVGFTYGLLFCAWSLLLWYSGILVRHGDTNGGKAFTTVINVIFSGFALGQAAPSLAAIAKGRVAAEKISTMIQTTNDESSDKSGNRMVLPTVSGTIEFCGVSFAYPSRPDMVFENLSLELASGKTFAVVGPSGSGKSTIISMVQRFYEPTSGKILLDGHDLKFLNLKWLREQMGMVSQEPALFGTTIFENILLGKQDSDMNQIVEAAKAANAHSFIETLPDGYYTQVGEGGTQLSGGQKQRIAIARAVLRNPKILLLDEATSALDAESESIVQQALDRVMSNRTTIVVAHRLSTIRDVDMIVVLKNGQVVETGTHSELSTVNGEYASLVNLQVSQQAEISGISSHSQSSVSSSIRELNDIAITASKYEQYDPQKLPRQSSDQTPSIWELVKLNAPEWPYAILGSIGAIAAGILAPMFSLGITHVLSAFYSFNDTKIKHEIQRVALIFVALAVVTIPVYLFQHYFYTVMGEKLTSRIRLLMLSAILCNEVGWFDLEENSIGSLTSILAADATLVRSSLADRLSTLVQNAALTISAFVVAFVLSWRIAAVVMASLPLLIGASIAEQLFLKGFGGDYTKSYAKATSVAREAIANIRTVAAFGAEDRVSAQFASQLDQPGKKAFLRGHIAGFGYGLSNLFAFCSYALGLWYASILVKENESKFGDIMKSFMVLIVTALGIAETLALTPDIVKGSQALGSVFRILKRKTVIEPNCSSSNTITHVRGDMEFKNVKFSYPSRPDIIILNSLNLNVPAGKSLAVVGPSGSGKSTVIGLAMRFYDPHSGQVLLDGQDIKTLNLRSLRKRIGLVQQEPALFATTIYENIKYGNEEASEIEVLRAARAANADNFISQMPDGYNTQVGERGVQLSGGQKQRVAIARAILKDPAILLLDEATSALDAESERAVREALSALMERRTTVVVAHRLSTIRDADRIAVLRSGNVVEMGNHEELVGKAGGVYKQLVSLQHHADCNPRT